MQIRALVQSDLPQLEQIEGLIDSADYLHVESSGEGLAGAWRLEERPLRQRQVRANLLDDECLFTLKQLAAGMAEGLGLVAEHEGRVVALLLAKVHHVTSVLRLMDLRVDLDHRREGLGTALLFGAVQHARQEKLRAVGATSLTNNVPAGRLLAKSGFELSGLDVRRYSNHDLVKEAVALFWYAELRQV